MTSHSILSDIVAIPHPARPMPSLATAYGACRAMTHEASKSFSLASQMLPAHKRRAIDALYAFCRTSDDVVDEHTEPLIALERWVAQVHQGSPSSEDLVLMAWLDTSQHYKLPQHLADELLAGVTMDLTIKRYATFDDLWVYCYRVASVVGLLAMRIIGYEGNAEPYAIKLGIALQLTNILRDVGEDARRGRIYLPQEDLERFNVREEEILLGVTSDRFRALMRFEIARTESWFRAGWPGVTMIHRDGQLAVATAAMVYRAILPKIVANDYDVFNQRAFVPLSEKLLLLPRIQRRLWRLRQGDQRLGDCLKP